MKKETSDIAPPRPRGTFSLFFMYFRECFNPERRGIPLYLNPLDIPRYLRKIDFGEGFRKHVTFTTMAQL